MSPDGACLCHAPLKQHVVLCSPLSLGQVYGQVEALDELGVADAGDQ